MAEEREAEHATHTQTHDTRTDTIVTVQLQGPTQEYTAPVLCRHEHQLRNIYRHRPNRNHLLSPPRGTSAGTRAIGRINWPPPPCKSHGYDPLSQSPRVDCSSCPPPLETARQNVTRRQAPASAKRAIGPRALPPHRQRRPKVRHRANPPSARAVARTAAIQLRCRARRMLV